MKFFLQKIIIGVVFISILTLIIALARGQRIDFKEKKLISTGILVASSTPDGGKIYINGDLNGATNSNITLPPGTYDIEIKKDGYSSWKKQVTIKSQLIVKADALLFPQNPSLSPITSLGIVKAVSSPTTDKIILFSENDEPEKDGVYLLENSKNPLSIINPLKLLVLKSILPQEYNLTDVEIEFSPDEKEFLLNIYDPQLKDPVSVYLIPTEEQAENLFDVTQSVDAIKSAWEEERSENLYKMLETFDEPFLKIATQSFDIVGFSPDEEKILYSSKTDLEIPIIIKPRLVSTKVNEEERNVKKGNLYVYDKKEDINFKITDADNLKAYKDSLDEFYMWYPDSTHLVIKEEKSIAIMDYDGSNKRTVYSGPFEKGFLSTTKDGKLFTLINLNSQKGGTPDVYTIGIR